MSDLTEPVGLEFHTGRASSPPVETSSQKNCLKSFSVTKEKQIEMSQVDLTTANFNLTRDRDLLVTICTQEDERWIFENSSVDTILCEIAAKIRNSNPKIQISPLELLIIGREIGRID